MQFKPPPTPLVGTLALRISRKPSFWTYHHSFWTHFSFGRITPLGIPTLKDALQIASMYLKGIHSTISQGMLLEDADM